MAKAKALHEENEVVLNIFRKRKNKTVKDKKNKEILLLLNNSDLENGVLLPRKELMLLLQLPFHLSLKSKRLQYQSVKVQLKLKILLKSYKELRIKNRKNLKGSGESGQRLKNKL